MTEIQFVVTANPMAIFTTLGIIHVLLMIALIAAVKGRKP